MSELAADPRLNREVRLAVLVSLGVRTVLLPLGILLPIGWLLQHRNFFGVVAIVNIALIVWKLYAVSRLYRKPDLLTLCFGLLSAYCVAFIALLGWLLISGPEKPSDLLIAASLYIIAGTFIVAGSLVVFSPQVAGRLNELAVGRIRLDSQAAQPVGLGMRVGGVFLTVVGLLLFALAVKVTLMAVGILSY